MVKALYMSISDCTGCQQCEMACSYEHEGVFNPAKSRIKVFNFPEEGRNVPYSCTQCADAWCMQACPVDAIYINTKTGAKEVSDALCVGCKVCTIACPFGTINYNHATGKVIKCDLCGGDPKCVEICPTPALTYIDAEQTGMAKMRLWAKKTDAGQAAQS
ncbi:MAG: 4Fe-4S dicluster domain-containing protein [Rhodospirillaceae bacterium]|nr:4Fe-4S dicluster domain-containing protein [Rhodospirillaceae bacterium]